MTKRNLEKLFTKAGARFKFRTEYAAALLRIFKLMRSAGFEDVGASLEPASSSAYFTCRFGTQVVAGRVAFIYPFRNLYGEVIYKGDVLITYSWDGKEIDFKNYILDYVLK